MKIKNPSPNLLMDTVCFTQTSHLRTGRTHLGAKMWCIRADSHSSRTLLSTALCYPGKGCTSAGGTLTTIKQLANKQIRFTIARSWCYSDTKNLILRLKQ
jgi:hypothetical protein